MREAPLFAKRETSATNDLQVCGADQLGPDFPCTPIHTVWEAVGTQGGLLLCGHQ